MLPGMLLKKRRMLVSTLPEVSFGLVSFLLYLDSYVLPLDFCSALAAVRHDVMDF